MLLRCWWSTSKTKAAQKPKVFDRVWHQDLPSSSPTSPTASFALNSIPPSSPPFPLKHGFLKVLYFAVSLHNIHSYRIFSPPNVFLTISAEDIATAA